jgi:hypothetical protein
LKSSLSRWIHLLRALFEELGDVDNAVARDLESDEDLY